ncbi:PLP-dependent transferase [Magnetovirga frankeli]|nr:PLP-dependent transferase [gamma proteobacterium SS-5]
MLPTTKATDDPVIGQNKVPVFLFYHGLSAEERARRGISDGMLRLSIGLEDPKDLIADLHQALAAQATSS